jgi:hypothetical protein
MPRNQTTGDFDRVSNSFSEPVYGTVIDPTDANSLFDDYDTGLTFDDTSPLILIGSTAGITKIQAADTASGTITLPAGTTDFSATGGSGQFVRQESAGAPFTVTTVPASAIASPAALTRTDDTNVTVTLGGAPSTALLSATSLTLGWTGTLAANRLNANVVQAITNDTNVTGSIAAQDLTLGWTGELSLARGGTNANLTPSDGGIFYSTSTAGAILPGTATAGQIPRSGVSSAPSWSTATYPATASAGTVLAAASANTVAATSTPVLGVAGSTVGSVGFQNATSGTITLAPVTGALGTVTLTLPAATDTVAVLAASQAFTNKTYNGLTITSTTGTLTITSGKTLSVSNSLTLAGTDSTTMTFPATSSTVLTTGNTATITKGYSVTPNNLGTVTTGTTTPDPANGNYQYYTNGGAHTLAAPASDCAIDLLVTNNGSAGSITFSGFTVGANTGSALTTTDTNKFLISLRRINSVATYSIYALQ